MRMRNAPNKAISRAAAQNEPNQTQRNARKNLTFPTNGGRCKRTHNGVGRSVR